MELILRSAARSCGRIEAGERSAPLPAEHALKADDGKAAEE